MIIKRFSFLNLAGISPKFIEKALSQRSKKTTTLNIIVNMVSIKLAANIVFLQPTKSSVDQRTDHIVTVSARAWI